MAPVWSSSVFVLYKMQHQQNPGTSLYFITFIILENPNNNSRPTVNFNTIFLFLMDGAHNFMTITCIQMKINIPTPVSFLHNSMYTRS